MWEVARSLAAHAPKTEGSVGTTTGVEENSFKQQIVIPLAVLILILYVVLGHSLELWKDAHKANPGQRKGFLCTFHESGPAILLGLAVGLMVSYGVGQQFDFNADAFFYVVLPPIIFHQGYALKKRNFFKFFHYIFSFGFLGTVIQFVTITVQAYYFSNSSYLGILQDDGVPIGLSIHECMLMAAVFSAADEVATLSLIKQAEYPKLSAVLFGEGVLNDAMSILLFHTVRSEEDASSIDSTRNNIGMMTLLAQAMYILISAAAVGMGSGLMISRLLKTMDSLKNCPVRQTAILMLGGYLSFSLSEALDLSGILAVFFCGLTLSHYAWHNLGDDAQVASKITSETLSMIAEAYCFASIGLSVHEFDGSQWCWGFIVVMILVLMIARALSVYGICLGGRLCFPKSFSMPIAEQHVLFFGGLVRGAIAWAQVVQVHDAHRGVMVTTSLGVILFTTVFFGAVMPFFTRGLKPERPRLCPISDANPSQFRYLIPTDTIPPGYGSSSNMYSWDPSSVVSDGIGMMSTASSIVNPLSVRGIVHRYWNSFDNRYLKDLFGGPPHENEPSYDPANHLASFQPSPGNGSSVGGNGEYLNSFASRSSPTLLPNKMWNSSIDGSISSRGEETKGREATLETPSGGAGLGTKTKSSGTAPTGAAGGGVGALSPGPGPSGAQPI